MTSLVLLTLSGFLAALVLGGSLGGWRMVRVRWMPFALAALALQLFLFERATQIRAASVLRAIAPQVIASILMAVVVVLFSLLKGAFGDVRLFVACAVPLGAATYVLGVAAAAGATGRAQAIAEARTFLANHRQRGAA